MDPSLGINKQSKQIRKPSPPPPQQIYNISKNDFRAVVQQLTGSPSRDHLRPQPQPQPQPRPPSSRLFKIRPPPLSPIAPPPHPNPRAPAWEPSPVSAYMRFLESSLLGPASSSRHQPPPPFPSPPSLALLSANSFLSPRPTSLPSLSGYLNLLSPRSPYPLISPGFQYPPPLVFSPSPHPETLEPGTGGHGLPAPPSPGFFFFPQSPSGFLPSRSPRWRDES
ncbi:protein HAIKU1-like [Curcuma longa]|uniref:protein HAIKU1-like n=1 Tax=Curcuma longa TaxID=136217 RepID=UPI003D9F47C6